MNEKGESDPKDRTPSSRGKLPRLAKTKRTETQHKVKEEGHLKRTAEKKTLAKRGPVWVAIC